MSEILKTKQVSVLSSLAWKIGEKTLLQGLAVVVQIILARLLLPSDFAAVALINAVINYLGLFVQSGLSTVISQKKDIDDKDLSTLMTYSLCAALLLYSIVFFLAPLLSDYYNVGNLELPIRVASLSLFLYSFNSIQTGILSRQMRFKTIFFRSIIAMPIAAVIAIIMAFMGLGIWALIANTLLNIFITVVIMNIMPELRVKLGFSVEKFKHLFSFTGKILLTTLVSGGGDSLRTLAIGKVYNVNSLAYYDRAYYYANLVTQTVNNSIQSVLLPVFSKKQDCLLQVKNMARRSVSMSAYIMIPMLTMVALVSSPLIYILLSEKWLPCAPFLSLFCILRIPCIITSVDKQVYYALGKSHIGLYFEISLLFLNILSLLLMIPLGVMYVAIGFTIVEYLSNLILCIVSAKVYGYTIQERINDLSAPLLFSLIMVAFAFPASFFVSNHWSLLLCQITICLIVFVLLSILTKNQCWSYAVNIFKNKKL